MLKTAVFWPQKANFCKASLTFDPKKLYIKFHQNPFARFAIIALRPENILGTNNL